MPFLGQRLQNAPFWIRWPIKWLIFAIVVFIVCYPYPTLVLRHIRHLRHLDSLPDPTEPALAPLSSRLDSRLKSKGLDNTRPRRLLPVVEEFVREEIPYAFDWDTWGVADYVPTVAEVISMGREDCDGQAVLATALLRARGIEAHLLADTRHMWISTPAGEAMGPLGPPAIVSSPTGTRVQWWRFIDLGNLAVGITLFPVLREAIILLTAWVLLLPPGVRWQRAALGLFLLVEAWILLRLAGANPRLPNYWAARWAVVHVIAAIIILALLRSGTPKDTDRSVS